LKKGTIVLLGIDRLVVIIFFYKKAALKTVSCKKKLMTYLEVFLYIGWERQMLLWMCLSCQDWINWFGTYKLGWQPVRNYYRT